MDMAKNEREKTGAYSGEEIEIVPAYGHEGEIRELFGEYTAMLVAGDSSFGQYLQIQNYEGELEHLEKKYGLPWGRLYLALCGGRAAGCIALRRLDGENCEMKRLYVRPAFRGSGLGEKLVRLILADAREIGYTCMRLDTLPFLESAIRLYKKLGFTETASYNDSPMDSSVFMKLEL